MVRPARGWRGDSKDEGGLKLKIQKLGRIQSAELDVRPLTVFIGPNNTNKTWTAYTLYGIFQTFSRALTSARYLPAPSNKELNSGAIAWLTDALKPVFDALKTEPTPTRVECSFSVQDRMPAMTGGYAAECDTDSISRILGVTVQQLPDASARLELRRNELSTSVASIDLSFERSLNRLQVTRHLIRRLENSQPENFSTVSSHASETWTEQKIFELVYAELWSIIEHVVVFPAERNGIIPVWPLLSMPQERLEVPIPVLDFGRFLGIAQAASAESIGPSQSRLLGLLKKVVGGEIAYAADAGRKRLVFRAGNAEVPLQAAASLSRAVAGLSIYIERFFRPDDVLIIDELEMNAHPQAQMALTEFIAALVNAGVRVVFTTHSPYVVDHLNNLMEASRTPEARREELARKFALNSPSSFISPEKVAVHAFQEETPGGAVIVREVLNRKTGLIDWSTFSKVSEHITNLYSDILKTAEEEA